MLGPLIHDETVCAVTAERALLRRLEGGCQVPIGACGSVDGGLLHLRAVAGSLDGTRVVRGERSGPRTEADAIGTLLAGELLAAGGEAILREIRAGS
jgi:hydroxymethylbilane synthase